MRGSVPDSGHPRRSAFEQVAAAFLAQPGLPFAGVLSGERIEQAFVRHCNLFGKDAIYSTVITVWSFLSQVLRDGKEASLSGGGGAHRGPSAAVRRRRSHEGY